MELVNFEEIMRSKLNECEEWLVGKEKADERLAKAEKEYEEAKYAVAEYTEENISRVVAYKNELKAKLGIVDEPVEEVVAPIVEEAVPVEETVIA